MILIQILIGSMLLVITTIIHAAGMAVGMHVFTRIYQDRLGMASMFSRSLVIGALILIMFVTTIIESGVWAVTYTRSWAVMGIITGVLFFLRVPLRNHASLAAENLALRQQLGVLRRSVNQSCGYGSLFVKSGER